MGVVINATPTRLTPGKDLAPIVQEAGWAPGPVWTGAENFAPTDIRSPNRPAVAILIELSRPANNRLHPLQYQHQTLCHQPVQMLSSQRYKPNQMYQTITVQQYGTTVQYNSTVQQLPYNNTTVQYNNYSTTVQYNSTVQQYSATEQYNTVQQYNTTVQYNNTVQQYNTTVQYNSTVQQLQYNSYSTTITVQQ
jgi:hypothetical protein